MKENIFPEIKGIHYTTEGIYRFSVNHFQGTPYSITGEAVQSDSEGYFVDLSKLQPGKHSFTFIGKCYYDGAGTDGKWEGTYDFPIHRVMEVQHPTHLNPATPEMQAAVFPNPCSTTINITGIDAPASLTITDTSARVVHSSLLHSTTSSTDLSALSPGMYFITLKNTTTGAAKTLKISKE